MGLLVALGLLSSSCTNIYSSFSNENRDEAIVVDARTAIDNKNYDTALTDIAKLPAAYQSRRDVLALAASAYAGRGGLDFVTLAQNVLNIGTTNIFLFIMQNFDAGTSAKMADLLAAQNKMLSISTTMSALSNDELMELLVIAFGNMGTIMSKYEDPGSTGAPTAGSTCSAFPAWATPLPAAPNDAVEQFGVSLNYAIAALSQLSTNGVSFGVSVSNVSSACATLAGIPALASYSFCGVYTASAFTQNQYKGILSLMNEKTAGIGLGTCNGDIVACACP